jgi:enoyl-CoA hydratase/carnithine racemase
VRVDVDGHVAVLTVDRPDRLNAMTNELDAQLWSAFEAVFANDDVYSVLWRAEGRAFSAGRDVSQLGNRTDGESDYHYIAAGLAATERMLIPPKVPVICAIQGWCIGGGFERTLLCDVRIAADDAKFRLPELEHGVIPDSGGTARLFQICGPGLVSDLVLTGRVLDAEEALRHGIVSRIVPRDDLDAVGLEIARAVARLPPLAVRAWRQNLNELSVPAVAQSLHAELLAQMLVYRSDDFAELKQARLDEREPVYRVT